MNLSTIATITVDAIRDDRPAATVVRDDHGWGSLPSKRGRDADLHATVVAARLPRTGRGVVNCPTCDERGHERATNIGDTVLRHTIHVADVVAVVADVHGDDMADAVRTLLRSMGHGDFLSVGCKVCNDEDERERKGRPSRRRCGTDCCQPE